MPDFKGSQTQANLKEAFAGESQANRRYLYFAQKADIEGYPDVVEHGLRGRVARVFVQRPEHGLALRRDLQASLAERLGELVR